MIDQHELDALLAMLVRSPEVIPVVWNGWQITPIDGGRNNLLFRATRDLDDFAVKFTVRDAVDRAGCEYHALLALRDAGFAFAPAPILLDRDRYEEPVVVQSWLTGEILPTLPDDDVIWDALLDRFLALHRITPETTSRSLAPANLTLDNAAAGRARIASFADRLPADVFPTVLQDLLDALDAIPLPQWTSPRLVLCHGDPNVRNFICRPDGWALVDWEYSGWGDPAFDVCDLLTHPAQIAVPRTRWEWVIEQYALRSDDPGVGKRIRTYCLLMVVAWVAYFAHRRFELDHGLGRKRLVHQEAVWRQEVETNYRHFVRVASECIMAWRS